MRWQAAMCSIKKFHLLTDQGYAERGLISLSIQDFFIWGFHTLRTHCSSRSCFNGGPRFGLLFWGHRHFPVTAIASECWKLVVSVKTFLFTTPTFPAADKTVPLLIPFVLSKEFSLFVLFKLIFLVATKPFSEIFSAFSLPLLPWVDFVIAIPLTRFNFDLLSGDTHSTPSVLTFTSEHSCMAPLQWIKRFGDFLSPLPDILISSGIQWISWGCTFLLWESSSFKFDTSLAGLTPWFCFILKLKLCSKDELFWEDGFSFPLSLFSICKLQTWKHGMR